MIDLPDHPAIKRTLDTGYPKPVQFPLCPICGEETDTFIFNKFGECVGCDDCIERKDAWEEIERWK